MKRLVFFICTLLCANVLMAQTRFWVDSLQYEVTSINPAKVEVYDANSSITTATIPSTVTYQGTDYSVTSIGGWAFESCSSLTSVTIPNSVTSIGGGVFYNCSSLTSVTLSNNITGLPHYYDGYDYYGFFEDCSSLTSVTIPNSVTSIGREAFEDCSSLTSINIPNSVTSIVYRAFYNCSSLTSVTLGNSVTSIGYEAFRSCSSLTNLNYNAINCNNFNPNYHPFDNCPISTINIGDSVQIIPNYFAYNLSLTSVNLGNSVTSIGESAFHYCSSLTFVTLGENVTSIGNSAFSSCSSLAYVTIPNSVTSIGNWAFYNCSSLTSVNIPNSVTSIGNSAFYNCSSLTSAIIGNGVTSIGYEAFQSCSSLTSVTIPNSVTSIGNYAFQSCSSLTNLNYNAINCNNFDSYNHPFNNCPISTINIGDSVQIIPNCFAYNLSLTSVTIPNSVTSIGSFAFNNCSSLTSVTLGENVTSIASGAFNDCFFLQNVTCLATNPPTLADNIVFPYPNIATLTVPCGTLEAYSSPTSFWNAFFAGRISENGYNVEVSVNDETFGSVAVESDCSTGTLTATANEGYVFLSWNDGNTDNPRTVALTSDTAFTAIFALIDNSSLSEDAEFAELSSYPNPTRGKVSFSQAIEKIEVIDLSGKTLQTYENANEINIEALPAGVYHLRMTIEDKTTTRKVIKD